MLDLCSLMNIMIILIRPEFDSTSMLVLELEDFLHQILLGHSFIMRVYHVCAGGGWVLVYGEMDYYPDEKKKKGGGKKKSDLWLIHYLLTKFPPPVFVTPPFSYTPAC